MEPEDELELTILSEMEKATTKGQSITLTKITQTDPTSPLPPSQSQVVKEFRVEMRVNGHSAKVTRNNDMLEQYKIT